MVWSRMYGLAILCAITWTVTNGSGCDGNNKWRIDNRCGAHFPTTNGSPAECNPDGNFPCCSPGGFCGIKAEHCTCSGCIDYRGPQSTEVPTPTPTEAPLITATVIPTLPPCEFPVNVHNVARDQPARQSSDRNGQDGGAENAVDGNYNSDAYTGSCSWTNEEYEPWWQVDLGTSFDIYEIVITNRADCCFSHIKNAEIRVGDNGAFDDNPVCGMVILGRMARDLPIHIRCGCETPMRGRFVSIKLIDKTEELHMCEVEVMAV